MEGVDPGEKNKTLFACRGLTDLSSPNKLHLELFKSISAKTY